jgi:hypothetical protein
MSGDDDADVDVDDDVEVEVEVAPLLSLVPLVSVEVAAVVPAPVAGEASLR